MDPQIVSACSVLVHNSSGVHLSPVFRRLLWPRPSPLRLWRHSGQRASHSANHATGRTPLPLAVVPGLLTGPALTPAAPSLPAAAPAGSAGSIDVAGTPPTRAARRAAGWGPPDGRPGVTSNV